MSKQRWIQSVGIVLALAVPGTLVAQQAGMFQEREVLSASKLNALATLAAQGAEDAEDALSSVKALESKLNASARPATSATGPAVRVELDNCTSTGVFTDCTCATNEVAIGGGGCAGPNCINLPAPLGTALAESANMASVGGSIRSWRVSCENTRDGTRRSCADPHAICLRVGS
jgi:hypothetical protein